MITINLEKAKNIKKDMLREERKPLLQDLDVQFQRSLETNSDISEIVTEKQRLRDITDLVDDCESIDQLNQIEIKAGL